MSLRTYHTKRHFTRTAEPKGRVPRRHKGWSYVIQKHAATRLHYDFRLELDGVLLSWAVPKGPSLDPHEKRLAVHVEDHPLDYADFEGTIPEGEYGGGTVMVWDRGTWESLGDPRADLKAGKLSFVLHGEKLQGEWTLVRMHGRGSGRSSGASDPKENWLLLKADDDAARPLGKFDVLAAAPRSAVSDRSMDEIASGNNVWRSAKHQARASKKTKEPPKAAKPRKTRTASKSSKPQASIDLAALGARRGKLPTTVAAQLATLVESPLEGDDWLHELKFDGYRMLCFVERGKARFVSRNGQDWTDRLGSLTSSAAALDVRRAALDGEVVVLDDQGVSRFQLLQNALGNGGDTSKLRYYVFDLLHLDGYELRELPLDKRRGVLAQLLEGKRPSGIELSETIDGPGKAFLRDACRLGLEGIVSKRRTAPYMPGRSTAWCKCKCHHEQEFVIGGFTAPRRSRVGFGSLLVGYYSPKHELTYAGRVGTGFSDRTLRELLPRFEKLEQEHSPFERQAELIPLRGVRWLRPQLVAQIEFANWTQDGLLRQPSFEGLREDKPATSVRRERPLARPSAARRRK
jgi:bifunctional non-homologous end joining protein LigD